MSLAPHRHRRRDEVLWFIEKWLLPGAVALWAVGCWLWILLYG